MDKKEKLKRFENQKKSAPIFIIVGLILIAFSLLGPSGDLISLLKILSFLGGIVFGGAGLMQVYGIKNRKIMIEGDSYKSSITENANYGVCPQCFKKINFLASKCPYCTAELNVRSETTKTRKKWVSVDDDT